MNFRVEGYTEENAFIVDADQNRVGIGKAAPDSRFHVYEDSAGTTAETGVTVENDGDGDSLIQFLLTTLQRWVIGIDNSDNDTFKISSSIDLDSDAHFSIKTNGNIGIGTSDSQEKLEVNGASVFTSEIDNGASGASATVDWSSGNYQFITLDNASVNLQFTDPGGTGDFILRIVQDGTGSRTISTWDTDIEWVGGVIPTLSTTANTSDLLRCFFNGTNYFCNAELGY